jgi:hypothetical protein
MITTTSAERIVQKSKGAHTICIRVKNEYNGVNMSDCSALLFYRLPVSGEWHPFELTPSEELYKGTHVEYKFLADTWLTQEHGDVEIEIRFYKATMNGQIQIDQYVRKATNGIIHISRSNDWASGIADSLLDTVDQRIIQLMMVQNRQDEMIAESYMNSASTLSVEDGKLYLVSASGEKMGNPADVIVPRTKDEDGRNDGLIELGDIVHDDSNPDCDCGCDHDNFEELDSYVATEPDSGNGNFSEL